MEKDNETKIREKEQRGKKNEEVGEEGNAKREERENEELDNSNARGILRRRN